ncbi:MAG: Ig-like domain-containing protein [Anaerolineales bacterium]
MNRHFSQWSSPRLGWLLFGALLGLVLAAGLVGVVCQADWFGLGSDLTVVEWSPEAGQEAGPLGPLMLTFNLPLEPSSLAARVRLDGGRPFKMDLDGRTVSITPARPLLPGPHQVTVLGGIQSTTGAALTDDVPFEFIVRQPQILFLRQQAGRTELYVEADGGIDRLSGDEQVVDYAVEPHGDGVLYGAANSAGGVDLWWVDRDGAGRQRWLDCGQDACSQPAWAPAGDRFAFTRRTRSEDGQLSDGRVWTAGRSGEGAAPLYQDPDRLGFLPTWSPDGRWLSFYDRNAEALILLDMDTVSEQVLPSGAGVGASWSPSGDQLMYLVLDLSQGSPRHLLYRVTPSSQTSELALHPQDGWQDVGLPDWSPSGQWIALSAQRQGGGLGRSLWRIQVDGDDTVEIAADPDVTYGGPEWSPAGDRLLFQRYPLTGSAAVPDLMLWASGSAAAQLEIEGAGSGSWLP